MVDAKEGTRRVVREEEIDKRVPEQAAASGAAGEVGRGRTGGRGDGSTRLNVLGSALQMLGVTLSPDGKWVRRFAITTSSLAPWTK